MNVLVLLLGALVMATLADATPSLFGQRDAFAEEEDLLDDMILTPAQRAAIDLYNQQYEALSDVNDTTKRKAMSTTAYAIDRWTDGKIPYIIDESLGDSTSNGIYAALKHWIDSTNLKFVRRTSEKNYVKFTLTNAIGCGFSTVGMVGGEQSIKLKTSSTCLTKIFGNAAHETGHAIGFVHEHCRSDRDDYIIVHMDNVIKGTEGNFYKFATNNYEILYDYGSLMHYPGYAFAVSGKITMEPKDKTVTQMGQKYGLSSRDIELVYKMYNGDDACFMKTDGMDYRGKIATTEEGVGCDNWKSHKDSFTDENYVLGGLGDHNRCRKSTPNSFSPLTNPPSKPWCYTSSDEGSKKYCNVGSAKTCESEKKGVECYSDPMGGDYKGNKNKAKIGKVEKPCVAYDPFGMQEGFAWCRNPKPNAFEGTGSTDSGSYGPWCYTQKRGAFQSLEWGYCDVGEPYIPC